MGKYCYVASARLRMRHLGAHGEERGGGILCRHAHSLFNFVISFISPALDARLTVFSLDTNITQKNAVSAMTAWVQVL